MNRRKFFGLLRMAGVGFVVGFAIADPSKGVLDWGTIPEGNTLDRWIIWQRFVQKTRDSMNG